MNGLFLFLQIYILCFDSINRGSGMYVYIEEVFLTNFIADFLMCRTLCAVKSYKHKTIKSAAAALIGTGYAFLTILNVRCFGNLVFKLLFALVMVYILGLKLSLKPLLIDFVILLALSCLCAGITVCISLMSHSSANFAFFSFNSVTFFEMLAGVGSGCLLSRPLIRYLIGRISFDKIIYDCVLSYKKNTLKAKMLADSGNLMCTLLKEPICIVREDLFYMLTGIPGALHRDYDGFCAFFDSLDEESKKAVSPAHVATVTGEAVATVVKTDALTIGDKELCGMHIAACPIANERVDGVFNPVILGGAKHEDFL